MVVSIWYFLGLFLVALIFHAQALVCDGSAYISEFLTFNKGPIVFLMCLYLEQASKGAGLEFLTFNKGPIVFLMVLYMKQGGRCQVGSVALIMALA